MSAAIAQARRKKLTDAMRKGGIDVLVAFGDSWQGDYLKYATDFGLVEGNGIATIDAAGSIALYLESAIDAERAAIESPDLTVVHARDAAGDVSVAGHLGSASRKTLGRGAVCLVLPPPAPPQPDRADPGLRPRSSTRS